jgi:hypothetical protein
MATSHGGGDLIAAIYDAIIEPSGWGGVVKRIVDATNSVSGGLHIQQADAAHLSAMCNVDPFHADAYVQQYYKLNPAIAALATIAPGEVWRRSPRPMHLKPRSFPTNLCGHRDGPIGSPLVSFARRKRSE